ncbi:MAG: hypothetical protein V2A77_11405 [Pseudomonadota bacterium]
MERQADELRKMLQDEFPGQVLVAYVDLRRNPQEVNSSEAALLAAGIYVPPVVCIDGQPKFVSELPFELIRKEVRLLLG